MATELANKKAEREALRGVIQQWNANRLDLFELSEPNEDLEFHGVMRFYFQDSGQKVATKCIRVASDATSQAVIETLIEKFRPDMRMLSVPEYALYEIHENGEERKLGLEEKPLLVQLNWHIDDREGRFLLRRIDDKTNAQGVGFSSSDGSSFRRKLSKREKKQMKKQEKLSRLKSLEQDENTIPVDQNGVAEKLYTELPETSFTRSISNPEAVMRRRRQQKLERKLQQFRSKDGGPDTGGTLKIYGEALCKDVPYKTLLLSVRDSAVQVVREMLSKYGLEKVDPQQYCLVQVNSENNINGGTQQEYILDDDECPLAILMNHPSTRGSIMFHVRRRPSDYVPRKRKKKPSGKWNELDYRYEDERLPFSLELNPDGSEIPNGAGVRHRLQPNVTEVGSERPIPIHPSSPSKSTSVPAAAVATVCHTRSPTHAPESTHNYETTFDLDGNVETASLTSSRDGNRTLQNDRQPRGTDPILPAVLEFLEETEETFFHAVITDVEPSAPQFKLAPTYTLYLAARYRASTHYRPELQPTERAHRLTVMLANVASMIQRVIQERYMDASSLALWLANGSELLHMLKNDRHVGAFSTRAQDILTEAVHTAFASLVRCISLELAPAMSQFMADADEPAKEAGVLQIFSSTMALLRRCRVNAALTIQLFSHLFHTINATAFNALVSNANLCVRWFGRRLKARLNALETWAERQGLELASQCHLATIMQATHLLQAPKYNAEELATLSSTCFKLNSLQVRALLQKYQPAADEPRLPAELIENVVRVAESVADTLARADGREIRLEEEPTLALALLLPEDGYSCEVIRGVPPGLAEFLAPLQRDGLCRMAPQPTSSGYWTIYMIDHHNNFRSPSAMSNRSGGYSCHTGPSGAQPEIHVIKLHKSTNGMGLSIVAAKGAGQDRLGIYIKSVVAGGAADADGRLTAGDQLLKVDGQSLVGITQEKAAEYLVRTGPIVTLEVAKQGAIYHGLATLLSQPSPVMTRVHKIRPKSENLEASSVQEMNEQPSTSHSMGNLLSVPRHAIGSERSIDSVPGAILSSICSKDLEYKYYHDSDLLNSSRLVSNRYCKPFWSMSKDLRQTCLRDHTPSSLLTHTRTYAEHADNESLKQQSQRGKRENVETVVGGGNNSGDGDNDHGTDLSSNLEHGDRYLQTRDRTISTNNTRASTDQRNHRSETTSLPFVLKVEQPVPFTQPMNMNADQTPSIILNSTNSVSTTTALGIKCNNFSLDSIPYIDQTDDTPTSCYPLNEYNEYQSENNNISNDCVIDVTNISRDDFTASNLPQCKNDVMGKYSRCSQQSMIEERSQVINENGQEASNRQQEYAEANKMTIIGFQALEQRDKNYEIREKKVENDISNKENGDSKICMISKTTPNVNNAVIPVLNLDLSGLDSDTSSDISTFNKCWKSPEEVRLGCGGRVAALAKHFSKLGDVEPIHHRPNAIKLLESSKKFASEPNVASIQIYQKRSDYRFPAIDDVNECQSELDLRNSEIKRRYLAPIGLDQMFEKSTIDLLNENGDVNYYCYHNNSADVRKGQSTDGKRKLSLSEQKQVIEQLREVSDLDGARASLLPFRSPSLPSFHVLNKETDMEVSNGIFLDTESGTASSLSLREIQANIQRFVSSWPTDIGENSVRSENASKPLLFDGKLIKRLANSYPNIEKVKELSCNEDSEQRKQRWCKRKKYRSTNELKRTTDQQGDVDEASSFLTNDQQYFRSRNEDSSKDNDNDNKTIYGLKSCKQNFIVKDKFQQNQMSRVTEKNDFNLLPIKSDQHASVEIEKETSIIDKDIEIDVKLDQHWKKSDLSKIYPRSSQTHLDIGFFLRKQLILLSHFFNACLSILGIMDVVQVNSYLPMIDLPHACQDNFLSNNFSCSFPSSTQKHIFCFFR